MQSVTEFALNSARRESEICRLEWRDNDEHSRTGMVRDAKPPAKKEGNHRRFKYTPEIWAVFTQESFETASQQWRRRRTVAHEVP